MSENKINKIMLIERQQLRVSGVLQVVNFDETGIYLKTTLGDLLISGSNLHVSHLLLEEQTVAVDGNIDCLNFAEIEERVSAKERGKNIIKKLMS